jgi:transcriptional regulator GlxA family with amidase domain
MSATPTAPGRLSQRAGPTRRVAMLVYPDAQILDISGPLEVFARTARWLCEQRITTQPAYVVDLIGTVPGPVRTSSGIQVLAMHAYDDAPPVDTLLVTGGMGYAALCSDARLLQWLQQQANAVRRLGSICTGAMILAAAGLLDGRAATTHWRYLDRLAAAAPGCTVREDVLYVRDGNIVTSAGVTAGIDLALSIVEEDHGQATAVAVAEELVVYRRRSAGQPQLSRFLQAERRNDRFGQLQLWVLDRLAEDLSVERLAEAARMSPRNFSRRFKAEHGMTPAAFVTRLRVEEACRRIEAGPGLLKDIARQCGFGDEQALRRAVRRELGVLPGELWLDRQAQSSAGAAVDR